MSVGWGFEHLEFVFLIGFNLLLSIASVVAHVWFDCSISLQKFYLHFILNFEFLFHSYLMLIMPLQLVG